ncbi:MAG TPA: outer membrane beta-barrel protein [Woeseiaceae bacterium]
MTMRFGQSVAGLAGLLSLAAAGPAAADFDYNYGALRYVDTELDAGPFDVDGDGFEIGGSLELTPSVHLFGNFETLDFGSGIDSSAFEIGGGYAMPLASGADLVARLSYIDGEIDAGPGDVDDNGFGFSAGFRHMFHPQIEGRAFINYVDLDESGDETSVELAGDYLLNEEIALGASLELGDDVTTWTLGARWYFGARSR